MCSSDLVWSFRPTQPRFLHLDLFVFVCCYTTTQLTLQLHQERTQVVYSNREARKRPARRHSRNGSCTWRNTQTHADKQKRNLNRTKHTSISTHYGRTTHTENNNQICIESYWFNYFLYISWFISCTGIMIILCIYVCYLYCLDCTYVYLTIMILVLFICVFLFYLCLYICIYVHIYICIYICTYICILFESLICVWIEHSYCNLIDWTFSLCISLDFMHLNSYYLIY